MKANMEAMKDQMAALMEAMLSMKKIMEVNATVVAATSTASEMDPTHPSGVNQISHPVPDVVGLGGEALGSTGGPHVVQRKNSFPLYSLPPNYAPPDVAHTPDENVNNSTPILIENQQPQYDHAHVSQPMGGHMKNPGTMLWPTSSFTLDMPLRGKHLVACPSLTPRGALSTTHNHNPCLLQWEESFLPWWKGKVGSFRGKAQGH